MSEQVTFQDAMRERAECVADGLTAPRSWAPTSWLIACHRRSPEARDPAHLVELARRELEGFAPPGPEFFAGPKPSKKAEDRRRALLLADAETTSLWLDQEPFEALRAATVAWAVRRCERALIEHIRAERKS